MDSQYFKYIVSNTDLSYSSYPTVSSIPTTLFDSLIFDTRDSPASPFSIHFESIETLPIPIYGDCLEHDSSTDKIFEATPSSSSSLDYDAYFRQSRPSVKSGPHYGNGLIESESALMSPDVDDEVTTTPEPFIGESSRSQSPARTSTKQNRESEEGFDSHQSGSPRDSQIGIPHNNNNNNLKRLLIACARALSENKSNEFDKLIGHARSAVSISGEPIQRLGAYLVEGLIARKESSGTNIYRSLKCDQPDSKDLLSYMRILYDMCPYLKFGYLAANGAIAEALKNEDRIHIVDFQIAQGTQWMTLLPALASRPGGPPHVRITGIDDPVSKYARGDGLATVGERLAAISEKFNIPVEFHPVPVFAPNIKRAMLDVRPGEALAVNFPLHLHHTPDESVDVSNPRDGILRMVKSLSPKVVTLVEQESNTNTAPFLPRFVETLDYYAAMFDSIDVTMSRDRKERINVEQHCLARDIVNIVACEGKARVERHELFGKWRSRFMMAGFEQVRLSNYVNSVIGGLLRCYSEHYTLVEKDGALLLGWKERNLVSASAWH